ncbi:IS1634 family transposase [Castellaniella sp. FW104-16D08]|uniref:IS1634 family transposase n=1 Tax=unclassified Castellaniella TaxID=2617606 RepID=UPI0033146A0C
MFVKVTKSGPRRYVQLVEAYRDEAGRPKQRTVATLGRLDQLSGEPLKSVHDGLGRILGLELNASNGTATFDSSRAFGDLWALTQIWKQLGLDRLRHVLRQRTRHRIDLEALLRLMVMNRLCDAHSKLGLLRWTKTVSVPELDLEAVTHQQLLRTMDAVLEHKDVIDEALAQAVRPLVDNDLSVVFYDMTTVRAEGLSEEAGDIRMFGMSKESIIARQFMLGLVQTADGIPLYHEVFPGNTAEVGTLKSSLSKVLERFPIRRVIAVADRGLLSLDNLEELQKVVLPSGAPLEFILAVPGRRYGEFAELLAPINARAAASEDPEVVDELRWNDLRLVVAHDRARAAEQAAQRDVMIAGLEAQAAQWVGKLDAQDSGSRNRGRKLSDGGVRARFYHAVCEAHLRRIVRVDLKSELFTYDIDPKALALARAMDGKLLLVTNTPDLVAPEVIARYKSLADIERGFKMLKSDIEIGPVYHRLPDRIRAHAYICFIALVLARVMRARLRQTPVPDVQSPDRALWALSRIQTHQVAFAGQAPVTGISAMDAQQVAVLASLKVKKPTADAAYANL